MAARHPGQNTSVSPVLHAVPTRPVDAPRATTIEAAKVDKCFPRLKSSTSILGFGREGSSYRRWDTAECVLRTLETRTDCVYVCCMYVFCTVVISIRRWEFLHAHTLLLNPCYHLPWYVVITCMQVSKRTRHWALLHHRLPAGGLSTPNAPDISDHTATPHENTPMNRAKLKYSMHRISRIFHPLDTAVGDETSKLHNNYHPRWFLMGRIR